MFRRIGQTRTIQPGPPRRALRGIRASEGIGASRGIRAFRPGDRIRGTVVQKLPEGEVRVIAGRRRIQAHVTTPLKEGEQYTFKVLTPDPRMTLRVLTQKQPTQNSPLFQRPSTGKGLGHYGAILRELGAFRIQGRLMPPLRKDLKQLRRVFPALVFRGTEKANPRWLSRAFVSSGLFWESKVARFLVSGGGQTLPAFLAKDLKGILLSLEKAIFEVGSFKNRELMLAQTREALQFIEQDQLFNLALLRDGIGWHWFIPGIEEEGFHGGEILAESKKEGEGIAITLLIQLSHLGPLRVELSLFEKVIHVRILGKESGIVDFIDRHLQELKKGFEATGMRSGFLKCEVDKDLDIKDITASWRGGFSSFLDVRI